MLCLAVWPERWRYLPSHTASSWQKANAICKSNGFELPRVLSSAENDALFEFIIQQTAYCVVLGGNSMQESVWKLKCSVCSNYHVFLATSLCPCVLSNVTLLAWGALYVHLQLTNMWKFHLGLPFMNPLNFESFLCASCKNRLCQEFKVILNAYYFRTTHIYWPQRLRIQSCMGEGHLPGFFS